MFKKLFSKPTQPIHNASAQITPVFPPLSATIAATTTNISSGNYSYKSMVNIPFNSQNVTFGSGIASGIGGQFHKYAQTNIISFSNPTSGQEIVKLNFDGSVEWANGIDIDAAAEAFGRTLFISAEQKVGITQRVKFSMRDSIFEDLIKIAKDKGSLTAEDLTYLLDASKIIERLKGGHD